MGIKTTKKDVVWNYVGTFMTMGSNFLLLPFLMYFLDSEILGLWYVFVSIGSIVNLIDFGFNPTLARNIAYCWSGAAKLNKKGVSFTQTNKPNYNLLKQVIGTCHIIYFIIACLAAGVMLTIGTAYINMVAQKAFLENYIAAWIIYCIAIFLNLYFGYYSTLLKGVGAISKLNIANIISRIFQLVCSVILLYLDFGLLSVTISYLINGLIYRLLAKYFFVQYKNMGKQLNNIKRSKDYKSVWEMFLTIWYNAWRDGVVSVSAYFSNQATTLIASYFFSLTETGIYSISVQLVTGIVTIASSFYNAYMPEIQSAYINGKKDRVKQVISVTMINYVLVFLVGMIGLIFVGVPIIKVIKSSYKMDIVILLTIGLYLFLLKRHCIYAAYIASTNSIPYMRSFLISSLLAIGLSFLSVYYTKLGILGIVYSQIIVQALYNNWIWPLKVKKSLQLTTIEMFKISIKKFR